MNNQRRIKVFIIHQWVMADLQEKIVKELENCPFCTFVDLSCPKSEPIPEGKVEFIQDIVCGRMMESDIVVILPDTQEGVEVRDPEADYLTDLSDPFRKNRGLHQDSVYAVEVKTLMFDACDTKPALILGWTKGSAGYLAEKVRNPRIGSRRYRRDRFYSMGLDEAGKKHAIAKKIIEILDEG
ncbi:MAG: hypothetical protein HUN04_04640 [Desulfobacter sp.]|nr:MAG: hypothetical protein HUN04_04640 [Desulfobacter sp.]